MDGLAMADQSCNGIPSWKLDLPSCPLRQLSPNFTTSEELNCSRLWKIVRLLAKNERRQNEVLFQHVFRPAAAAAINPPGFSGFLIFLQDFTSLLLLPGIWQTNAALSGPLQYLVFHLYPLTGSTDTHMPISWSSVNSPHKLLGELPMASNDFGGGTTSSLQKDVAGFLNSPERFSF